MKILLTGGSGQLGQELLKLRKYLAPSHHDMDITDEASIKKYLAKHKPDLIVHAAAYTNTSLPEKDATAAAACYKVNVLGTRNLVRSAACPIIFISTESVLEPHNFYVLTKIQAEKEITQHTNYKIIRTSFRFNPFEYDKACTDMLTLADVVEKIAPLVDKSVDLPCENNIVYVGTGVKTVYDLAKQTRPDVTPVTRNDLHANLPAMHSLLSIQPSLYAENN
ncbi:MAG TPA: sugar nucleotide-binding protein [Magnetospirillaceae bacterium]|nr:sugar nucleotide-binding protein [Magnetospirillaceae bacterium]